MPDELKPVEVSVREGVPAVQALHAEIAGVPEIFRTAARILFRILIVLIPFRARMVLRPVEIGTLYSDYTDVILYASDVAGLLTILMWCGWLIAERRKPSAGPWFLTWPLAGILAASVLSAFGSEAPAISWYHVIRLMALFGLFLYTVNEVENLDELKIAIGAMIAVQAVVAVAQYLVQRSLGLAFLGELTLDSSVPGASIVWAPETFSLRSYGLTDHPNLLAGALALGLIFLIAAYPRTAARERVPMFGVIVLGLIALLYSFSRSAWLALAAGSALILVRTILRHRTDLRPLAALGFTSAAVLLPFLLAAAPYLGSRLGIGQDARLTDPEYRSPEFRSLAERTQLNAAANAIFLENPITGVGIGTFPVAMQARYPDFEFDHQPVHFVLLLAAAETGLVGSLFYFLAVTFPWIAFWLSRTEPGFPANLLAASAALAGVTIIGLFDYYPWLLPPGRLWHWIIWGLWAGMYLRRRQADA